MRKCSLLLLILLTSGFMDKNPPDKKAIRCFRFTFSVPVIDKQGKSHGNYLAGDRRMFVCGDLVMLEHTIDGMEHREPDSDRYFKWYSYLVFQRDSALGIEYQTHYPDSSCRHRMDSVFKMQMTGEGLPLKMIGPRPHLVASTKDESTGMRTETYTRLGDSAQHDEDTCLLVFSDRLAALPPIMSLSPSLDSARGSRLVEIKCMFGRQFSKQYQVSVDPYFFSWKMEEQAFFNRDSALLYFNRYWQDSRSRH